MSDKTDLPYKVTGVKHERTYKQGGAVGGQYTVDIEHASGVKSSFVVPEGPTAPAEAHAAAMEQVRQAATIAALPPATGA